MHMLRVSRSLTVCLSLFAIASSLPLTLAQESDKEAVIKTSQAWNDAFNRRDLEAYGRHMSDGFVGTTDEAPPMTKAALIHFLSGRPLEYVQRKEAHDFDVHIFGDTAILTYAFTSFNAWGDTMIKFPSRRIEVFKKNGGGWLAVASQQCYVPTNHRTPIDIDSKVLMDYVGEYDWPRHDVRDIDKYRIEDGQLMGEWRGDKRQFLPMQKDTFFTRDDLGWTTFVRDPQGRVTGYVYHWADGQEIMAKKIR